METMVGHLSRQNYPYVDAYLVSGGQPRIDTSCRLVSKDTDVGDARAITEGAQLTPPSALNRRSKKRRFPRETRACDAVPPLCGAGGRPRGQAEAVSVACAVMVTARAKTTASGAAISRRPHLINRVHSSRRPLP